MVQLSGAGCCRIGLSRPPPGGPAPIVALWLYTTFRSSLPIALYMMGCAAVSLVAAALLRERSGLDLSAEYGGRRPALSGRRALPPPGRREGGWTEPRRGG